VLIRTFSIIGGASAYTPGLVGALLRHSTKLRLQEVRLFDIDAHRLEIVARLCQAMARAQEAPFRVTAGTDLRDAVRGADAVLNSARPGGFQARRIDETLPLEFDLPGQETVGPGGFLFALRSVPQALELARTMEESAPNSILLNYTNPTNIVTQALLDTTALPVVGLCDQADDDLRVLGQACGYKAGNVTYGCNGLNHATWYAGIEFGGVRFQLGRPKPIPPESLDEEHRLRFDISWQMARRHPRLWPNSYLAYYERPELFVALSRKLGPRTDVIVRDLDGYYEHFAEEALKARPDLRRHRGTPEYGDMAVRVLVALGTPRPRQLTLNVKNGEATEQLNPETVIETVVDVDQRGVHKSQAPELPDHQIPRTRALERYQRATARVAVNGDTSSLADALATNPLVHGRKQAEAILKRARHVYGDRVAVLSGVG
jgi:6-phospho-beta-glucosidase